MITLPRRRFLALAGLGAAAIATPEPVRRFWQVSRDAPVRDPMEGWQWTVREPWEPLLDLEDAGCGCEACREAQRECQAREASHAVTSAGPWCSCVHCTATFQRGLQVGAKDLTLIERSQPSGKERAWVVVAGTTMGVEQTPNGQILVAFNRATPLRALSEADPGDMVVHRVDLNNRRIVLRGA